MSICEYCENKKFTNLESLKRHIDTFHENSGEQPRYACFQCPKTISFSRENLLQNHIAKTHNQKGFQTCRICGQALSLNTNLRAHIDSVHKKIKSSKCEFCNQKGAVRLSDFSPGSVKLILTNTF